MDCFVTLNTNAFLTRDLKPYHIKSIKYQIEYCLFDSYHLKFEDFFKFASVKCTKANHSYEQLYVNLARENCYYYTLCYPHNQSLE